MSMTIGEIASVALPLAIVIRLVTVAATWASARRAAA